MKPRPPRCKACNSYYAEVHPDDQEGYDLPALLCRCEFKRITARLAAEGWSPLEVHTLPMVRKAGVPTRHHVGQFSPRGETAMVTFARWVPSWVAPILLSTALAESMMVACMKRCAADPERAAAAVAVQRLNGTGAMVDFLLNDLAPHGLAPEDAPDAFPQPDDEDDQVL